MTCRNGDHRLGLEARRLIRSGSHAALATSFGGRPYVSLVAVACDLDGTPLLLLSDLAQHTANLAADPALSLLFDGTSGLSDRLAGPRLTVLGRAERCDDRRAVARFTSRHPASAIYAGFADFHLYRVAAERGHLVAGFGRIAWIETDALRFAADASSLADSEAEIVAHMNAEHAAALELCAMQLAGRTGGGWGMTGIDPEGIDLARDGETARLDFAEPVLTPEAARRALIALVQQARSG